MNLNTFSLSYNFKFYQNLKILLSLQEINKTATGPYPNFTSK